MAGTADWESFKKCMKIQTNVDLQTWDIMLFQPLKDLSNWWSAQSDTTKKWTKWLADKGGKAFAPWVARVAQITETGLQATFAAALGAVGAGLVLGTFLDVSGRCISQAVSQQGDPSSDGQGGQQGDPQSSPQPDPQAPV